MPDYSLNAPASTTTRYRSGLLGTDATISVTMHGSAVSRNDAIDAIVATILRLERVFSVFDPTSDLVRFRSGGPGPFSPELSAVLALARFWHDASHGAFNPHVGAIVNRWSEAAVNGEAPRDDELDALVVHIDGLDYSCSPYLNLNAIAKGWIVDEALRLALGADPTLESAWVNLGGDIAHRGQGALRVALEDPRSPFDNAPPLARITIANQAVASSGGGRRTVRVGDQAVSHVIDPRCARPVDRIAGATVIADTAAEADVVATILTVLSEDECGNFVDGLASSLAYLVVRADRVIEKSPNFATFERTK